MEKRTGTNTEKLLMKLIISSPMTNIEWVMKNNSSLIDNDFLDVILSYLLDDGSNSYSGHIYDSQVSMLVSIVSKNAKENYKPLSGEDFFAILNKYINKNDMCYLKKETVGKLAKLTKEITPSDYLNNMKIISPYINVIKREHPNLKKCDELKLADELTKDSPIDILANGYGRTESVLLREISPDVLEKYRDRFSYRKIFSSKPTLKFLINNPEYVKKLTIDSTSGWYSTPNFYGKDANLSEFNSEILRFYRDNGNKDNIVSDLINVIKPEIFITNSLAQVTHSFNYERDAGYDHEFIEPPVSGYTTTLRLYSENLKTLMQVIRNLELYKKLNLSKDDTERFYNSLTKTLEIIFEYEKQNKGSYYYSTAGHEIVFKSEYSNKDSMNYIKTFLNYKIYSRTKKGK